jgi:undecaprenyl-diphosphatase
MTFGVPRHLGYAALALLVGIESAGAPVPGETALIAAAFLAQRGELDIGIVIVVASVSAIVGDNVGYLIGRKGGRALLLKPGPLHRHRLKVLERGEPFFLKHGAKAVFLGRWVAALRIAAAWLAGANRMPWPVFIFWNALGGIAWATSVGLAAFFLGRAAEPILREVGLVGAGVVALALLTAGVIAYRRHRRPA